MRGSGGREKEGNYKDFYGRRRPFKKMTISTRNDFNYLELWDFGSPSMTGAVRESVRMFLLQDVLTKGTPNAPEYPRTYHWFTRL